MVTVVPWAEQLIAALHQPHTQSLSLLLFLLDARAILDLLERVAASSDPHSVKCTGVDGELDLPEALQHFSAYLDELYLAFSVAADAARSRERPFHLAALASNDVDDGPLDDAAKFTARLCSLYKLASTLDGASTFAQSLDSLPEPDISLQSTMIQSLVNRRASQPPVTVGRTRSVGALRWVLASLLKHYLGEDHFGQHSSADHAGSIRYAKRDADDAAIRARFPRTLLEEQQRRSSTTGLQRRTSAGSVASTGTTATTGAVQASAEEQRAKRDDKLRWLFGENVNSKTLIIARSYAASPSSPSSRVLSPTSPLFAPPTPRYVRHPAQTPLSPPHRRAWSAGSEVAPSPSSAIFGRRTPTLGDPTHRKSVPSLDDTDADAESALSSSRGTSSSDLRRYDSIDTVDSRTALLPAPTARNAAPRQHIPYVGPFQSALVRIDDASPESSPPQPLDAPAFTDTRSGALRRSLSTRSEPAHGSPATAAMCFEDDDDDDASTLPSNTNNLSAAEKATLVRKSRKLKAVLGELVRDDQLLLSPAALANRRPAAPPPAGLSVQSSPYVVGADDDSEGEEKTPVPITAPTSPETRLFPDDGGESSAMSRASSAAFFGTDRHGDHTDAFTSPDMALGLKSPDVDPDSRAEVELDEYARRGSAATFQTAAAPLSPRSINTFSSEGDSPRMPAQARQASRTSMADAKEARRRKLMKVQAFLGERVPVSALSEHTGHHILRANAQPLVHSAPLTPIASSHGLGLGIASGASSNGDRKSKRTTKLLSKASTRLLRSKSGYAGISDAAGKGHVSADDQQQQRERAPKRAPSSRRLSKKPERAESGAEAATAPTGTSADWAYVRVEPGAAHESEKHKRNTLAVTGVSGGAVAEGADPAITAIRRARKLEKMFGSLPPAQMYSSRRPAQILAPRKLVPRDDRPRPLSFARASSSDRVLKSSSSTATSSLYRRSVASLRYIAESGDRDLLDDLARVVMAEEGEEEALREGNGQAGHADDSVQGDVSSTDDELGLPLIAAAGSQVEPPTRQGKTSHGSTTDEDESLLGGGRSSIDTTASLPAGFAYPSTSARLRSHPQLAHLYNPQRGSRGGTASRAGRDSAMSGVTVHSSADSAFDIGSPRSYSRASSSAGDDANPLAGAGVNGRSSMESVRIHFRRAHKLARVLGTTRGEVFNKVLDDIEADLAEDENEELDPLERRDILENVAALRASL